MTRVAFLVRASKRSANRYLCVAQALAERGLAPVFVAIDDGVPDLIAEQRAALGVDVAPPVVSLGDFAGPVPAVAVAPVAALAGGGPLVAPEVGALADWPADGPPPPVDRVLAALGIDRTGLLAGQAPWFARAMAPLLARGRALIARLDIRAVVCDIEFDSRVNGVILAARQAGVPSLCLQHEHGNLVMYDRMGAVCDHQTAYSRFNGRVLAAMGVPAARILTVGAPEHMAQVPSDQPPPPAGRPYVVVALKPGMVDAAFADVRAINLDLLRTLAAGLDPQSAPVFLIRRHPRDAARDDPELAALVESAGGLFRLVDSVRPLASHLGQSRGLITFTSSCLTEGVEMGVPMVELVMDDVEWPDWRRFGAWRCLELDRFDDLAADIAAGRWPVDDPAEAAGRAAFLAEFGLDADPAHGRTVAGYLAALVA